MIECNCGGKNQYEGDIRHYHWCNKENNMIQKFNTDCTCEIKNQEGYNETFSHVSSCGHTDVGIKEKINEIIDYLSEKND